MKRISTVSRASMLICLTLATLFGAQAVLAGGSGTGGADPRAEKAVEYGDQFVSWLLTHPHPDIDIDPGAMVTRIGVLSKSLDTQNPLLRLPAVADVTCFGVAKKGCTYDDADHSVDLAGKYWDKTISNQTKCMIANTEFVRPQPTTKIYEKVTSVCKLIYPSHPVSDATTAALQEQVEADQDAISELLRTKGHLILHEQNFELSGQVHGSIDGHAEMRSPISSILIGAMLGGVALGGIGAVTDVLVPFTLDLVSIAEMAAAGAAGGAVVGGLTAAATGGMKTGTGDLHGSLDGQISGRGWENRNTDDVYSLFVLEPGAVEDMERSPWRSEFNVCASDFSKMTQAVRNSKRFATKADATDLLAKVADIKAKIKTLRQMRFSLATSEQERLAGDIDRYVSWLHKRITLIPLGTGPLVISKVSKTNLKLNSDPHNNSDAKLVTIPFFSGTLSEGELAAYLNLQIAKKTDYGRWLQSEWGINEGDIMTGAASWADGKEIIMYEQRYFVGRQAKWWHATKRIPIEITRSNFVDLAIAGGEYCAATRPISKSANDAAADFIRKISNSTDIVLSSIDDSAADMVNSLPSNIPSYLNGRVAQ